MRVGHQNNSKRKLHQFVNGENSETVGRSTSLIHESELEAETSVMLVASFTQNSDGLLDRRPTTATVLTFGKRQTDQRGLIACADGTCTKGILQRDDQQGCS